MCAGSGQNHQIRHFLTNRRPLFQVCCNYPIYSWFPNTVAVARRSIFSTQATLKALHTHTGFQLFCLIVFGLSGSSLDNVPPFWTTLYSSLFHLKKTSAQLNVPTGLFFTADILTCHSRKKHKVLTITQTMAVVYSRGSSSFLRCWISVLGYLNRGVTKNRAVRSGSFGTIRNFWWWKHKNNCSNMNWTDPAC